MVEAEQNLTAGGGIRRGAAATKAYFLSTWTWARAIGESVYNVSARLIWIAICVLVLTIIVRGLAQQATVIELISVPKELADNGYTPDVAGRRLRDEITKFAKSVQTLRQTPDFAMHGELPSIVVPTVGISLDAIVVTLRSLLQVTRSRSITGEFIIREQLLWLTLRIDNREIYTSARGVHRERPDLLLVDAVPQIVKIVQPYFYALWSTEKEPASALPVIDGLITTLMPGDENIPWLYLLKGYVYREHLNNDDEAIRSYRKALSINPKFSVAYFNLGVAYGSRDEPAAVASYEKSIELDSKYADPLNNLANIRQDQGDLQEATTLYRKAIARSPKSAMFHNNLGLALLKQGELDGALQAYQEALLIDPKYARAHNDVGAILEKRGQINEAIAKFVKAIECDPKLVVAHRNYARLLEKSNQYEHAIIAYRSLIAVDPTDAPAYFKLAELLNRKGQRDEAVAVYRKFIELNPTSTRVADAQAHLE